jgi:hypothetical protein
MDALHKFYAFREQATGEFCDLEYDLVAAWESFLDAPAERRPPSERLSTDRLAGYVDLAREQYPAYDVFVKWLKEALDIERDRRRRCALPAPERVALRPARASLAPDRR